MSDRFYGEISLPVKYIKDDPEIRKAIEDYFAPVTYKQDVYKDMMENDDPRIATFSDDQACYGQFEEFENLLQKKKVPFDRYSSGYFEHNSRKVYFRPELSADPFCLDGEVDDFIYTVGYLKSLASETDGSIEAIGKKFKEFLENIPVIRPLNEYA